MLHIKLVGLVLRHFHIFYKLLLLKYRRYKEVTKDKLVLIDMEQKLFFEHFYLIHSPELIKPFENHST